MKCCNSWNPEGIQNEQLPDNLSIMPAVSRLVKFNYLRGLCADYL